MATCMASCDTSWLKLKGIGFIFWRTRRPREASVGFPSKHPGEIPPRTNSLVFCGWWESWWEHKLDFDLTCLCLYRISHIHWYICSLYLGHGSVADNELQIKHNKMLKFRNKEHTDDTPTKVLAKMERR